MTKGSKPLDNDGFDFEAWERRRPEHAAVINPIPTGGWSGDTSGELPDVRIPWEQAARYLASELIPDNADNRFLAIEAYSRTHPGQLPPLLDGIESGRAYLAVMHSGESEGSVAIARGSKSCRRGRR